MSEENKATMRRFVEEVQNQHNVDAMDRFFSPSFVNHDPLPGLTGTLDGAKQLHRVLFTAFPDLHMTIHDQAAEGDQVWTRKTATGTHQGEFLGIPATGRQASFTIMEIMRLADGKFIEHWVVADMMGLRQQLTAAPQEGEAAKK